MLMAGAGAAHQAAVCAELAVAERAYYDFVGVAGHTFRANSLGKAGDALALQHGDSARVKAL